MHDPSRACVCARARAGRRRRRRWGLRGRRRRPPSTSDEGVPSFTEFLCVRTLPPDSMDDLQPFSYLWSSYIVLIATHTHTHQSIRISGTYHVVIKPPLPQPPPTPFFCAIVNRWMFVCLFFSLSLSITTVFSSVSLLSSFAALPTPLTDSSAPSPPPIASSLLLTTLKYTGSLFSTYK